MDLVAIIVLTLVMIPAVILSAGALQVVLGIAFLVLFPGYALVAALFPRRGSLDWVERIALSIVVSIATVPMAALILNYSLLGIAKYPVIAAISGLILVSSVVALLRRRALPREERFEPRVRLSLAGLRGGRRLDLALYGVLGLATLGAVATLAYVIAVPRHVQRFSEFYLLGSDGMMEDYGREATVGERVTWTLGIINHERGHATYTVEITIDAERVDRMGPIELPNGGKWEGEVSVVPDEAGPDQEVAFLLYMIDGTEPYLTNHVTLDVREEA